jgi:hypothetical protein
MSYCKKHNQEHDTTDCPICEGEEMGERVEKRWATTKIFTCLAPHEKGPNSPGVMLSHYQCLARIFHQSPDCSIDCEKAKKMFINDDHYDTSNGFNMNFVNEVLHPNGYSLKPDPQTKESNMTKKAAAKKTSVKKTDKKATAKATTPPVKKTDKKTTAKTTTPAVKKEKKVTKQQIIREAFAKKATQSVDDLLALVGGSPNNLRVTLGILKNIKRTKDPLITTYDKDKTTFTLAK